MSSENRQVSVRQLKVKKCNTKCRLIVFATIAICVVAVAVFADRLCPYDPYAQDLSLSYQAPSAAHIMGTDTYGRDMFSRVIVGARASILSLDRKSVV